jgi:hypothetical protein
LWNVWGLWHINSQLSFSQELQHPKFHFVHRFGFFFKILNTFGFYSKLFWCTTILLVYFGT